MSIDEDHSVCPQRLTQDLLNVLHTQFPIVKDCEEVDFTDSAFQDPMVSMAGIATQGWGIHDQGDKSKKASHLTRLSSIVLPSEDASLLRKWTPEAFEEIIKEQSCYFDSGLYGSKRDVAWVLDPVYRKLVTEERAKELLEA